MKRNDATSKPDARHDVSATATRDQQTLRLLLEALDIEPEERALWLERKVVDDDQRERIGRMLADDALEGSLRSSAELGEKTPWFAVPLASSDASRREGTVLGNYRLEEVLGIGGMGVVYRAKRIGDYEQTVAIKVVRDDREDGWNLEQLGRERQILASLEHPGIARLLDGGSTPEGTPYLVMELVRGEPITESVRRTRASWTQVLELFADVCDVVAKAHGSLLVHGDLKPGNVLVTGDGTVKLLDFGVAQLLGEDHVESMVRPATPSYASPEHVGSGQLSVASDVYSLGVVLYQMLTSVLPRPGGHNDDVEPPSRRLSHLGKSGRPSSLEKRELDALVAKALDRDPQERYQSVADLARDCRHLVARRPVSVLPARPSYVMRKLVARHRAAAGALLAAMLGLVITAAVAVDQARRARVESEAKERQRVQAELQRERAEGVTEFVIGMFDAANVESQDLISTHVTVTEVLDRATEQLRDSVDLAPQNRLDLTLTLVDLEQSLHRFDAARALVELARSDVDRLEPSEETDVRQGWVSRALARVERAAGDLVAAETLYLDALARARGAGARRLAETRSEAGLARDDLESDLNRLETTVRLELAALFVDLDRCDEAVTLMRPVQDGADQVTSKSTLVDLANAANQLSECAVRLGDEEGAWQLLLRARDLMARGTGEESYSTAIVLSNLGQEARLQGRCDRAIEPLERSLAIRTEVGDAERDLLRVRGSLAFCLVEQGRADAARGHLDASLAALEEWPDGHFKKLGGAPLLGLTLQKLGEHERARPLFDGALAWQREMASESPYVLTLELFVAENMMRRGEIEAAVPVLERLVAELRERGSSRARLRQAINLLAEAYGATGREDQRGELQKGSLSEREG